MVYTVTLNPAIDKTVYVEHFEFGSLNRVTECRMDPGGKGINVSKTLNSLKVNNMAISLIAGKTGSLFRDLCDLNNLKSKFWTVNGETRINTKIVDKKMAVTTEVNEKGPEASIIVLKTILEELCNLIMPGDIVVLTGSIPEKSESNLYFEWATNLSNKGAKIILDASGENLKYGLKAPIYAVKPNIKELEELKGRELSCIEDIVDAGKDILQKGIRKVCISMGSKGFVFIEENAAYYIKPIDVIVNSTVGAGDAMVAAIVYSEIMAFSPKESAKWIAAAASAKIEKSGTEAPEIKEIVKLLNKVEIAELE